MNAELRKKLVSLPNTPGVYFHKSSSGEIIYVGKAANLRNRVRQYFQSSRAMDTKTMALVAEIVDTDWVEVESEIDALFLESEMVKRYMPRFNVLLRDDKSQLFVRIDIKNDWPTVSFTRNPLDDGADYIGPFYNGFALKKALRYLRRVFPYFIREPKSTDSKLEAQIGLNPDTQKGSVHYKKSLRQLIHYIKGNRKAITHELESEMKLAARNHEFEKAAVLRNKLTYMKELQRRVMFGDKEFLDISKDAALQQIAELFGLEKPPQRIECFDISHISGSSVVASMVVFTNGVSDRAEYRKFKLVERNDDYANMHDVVRRRFSVKNTQQWKNPDIILIDGGKGQLRAALDAMQECGKDIPVVGIAKRNDEIVYDVVQSHVSVVASSTQASIKEEGGYGVINLHAGAYKRSGHAKNLLGATDGGAYMDTLHLVQRIRDESHRFAISYHTTLRTKNLIASDLDTIPGIGPKSKKKLLQHFGGLKKIKQASVDELAHVVGNARAEQVARWSATIQNDGQ
jgi:excinuclease ABC subunit C